MTAPTTAPLRRPHRRRLFGLRRKPGRLAIALFRMPLRQYHHDRGYLFGRSFLLFVHVGRRTGLPHETVAMVIGDDRATGEVVICAAWGPEVDWVRNLRAAPAREVRIGHDRFVPAQRFLPEDEALRVATAFRSAHRARFWLLRTILGWGRLAGESELRAFVRDHPLVGFRPIA